MSKRRTCWLSFSVVITLLILTVFCAQTWKQPSQPSSIHGKKMDPLATPQTVSVETETHVPDAGMIIFGSGIRRKRVAGSSYTGISYESANRSLSLTVSPRIIISEEEERKYGVAP
ncbi:MAG: hypothetical protein AAGG44_01485 [Planctomycetota bacterium]